MRLRSDPASFQRIPHLVLTSAQIIELNHPADGGRDIPAFLKQYPEEAGTPQLPLNNKTRKVGADTHSVSLLLRKSVEIPKHDGHE
ncbi:MAG TPA: hypothetical protein DD723_02530 [Candidatus Omnitrophica bacterium]|nr:MAG: hypothetical protein A2X62_10755 [Stygiobacter sp. GWC2_38_9]OGW96703.1 MAG: hypothetical protein A2Z81_01750 [Omnitrophica WOR_2 bacterium GWA2_45_18]HBR14404.1 hypothetical protein [Candidatus Omnitrophota bacterium]